MLRVQARADRDGPVTGHRIYVSGHRFYALAHDVATIATTVMVALILWLLLSPEQCMSIDAAHMPQATVTELTGTGWFGDPTDGEERLFSPACRIGGGR